MNKQQAQELIRETFETPFDKSRFNGFVRNLLNHIEEAPFTYKGNYIPEAYRQYIKTLERIGKYSDGKHTLDILIITLQKETSLERARTMQRNFIAWYLNGSRGGTMKDAALVAYVAPNHVDWRFSLVKMDYTFEKTKTGKMKVKEEFTPARRWSFLVGSNEKSHTAQSRLVKILADDEQTPTLDELEEAFNIESVTKEFFLKYRELFLHTKEALDEIVKNDTKVKTDFDTKGVDTVNFAKKLLGQIVFLYFLQKKGWFGVGRDDDWGSGSKKFLRELFSGNHGSYHNFFNDILEPLFYEALRIDRSHDDDYYSRFNCKIPFLNGGLFDPIGNYDWVHTDIHLPNDIFSNERKTKEGDTGTGILDVFDRYNFTVREDEPLEKEVAIDPELLGKAYEKFNAIRPDNFEEFTKVLKSGKKGEESKFNKKFGVYYTPREIVHYMCKQSLINYLATQAEDTQLDTPISKQDIEDLIEVGELITEHEATALIKEKNIKEGIQKASEYTSLLADGIRGNAKIIDGWLEEITVCDPAVGSGAFPVGMMNEIVRLRSVLSVFLQDGGRSDYDFKRRCIEHSLYGVDIDPGAVEIAKLRLWLSLVVDEEDIKNIKPLPNLDYKIVCGNSLLGYPYTPMGLKAIEKLKEHFFYETRPSEKNLLRKEIDKAIYNLFEDTEKSLGYKVSMDFKINFSEVFSERGGFDVVIANPPYYTLEVTSKINKESLKLTSKVYAGKADIHYFFYEKGINVLNNIGTLCFITSRYFIEATYAKLLRKFIVNNSNILQLIDFPNCSLFEDIGIHNSITILSKKRRNRNAKIKVYKEKNRDLIADENSYMTFYKNFYSESWLLANDNETTVFNKLINFIPLKELAFIEQGQKTGANSIFCINYDTLTKYKLEKSLVKRLIKNSDVSKYHINLNNNRFLIYIDDAYEPKKYPNVHFYLKKHKKTLENRSEIQNKAFPWYRLQRPRRIELFETKEKILVPYRAEYNRFGLDEGNYIFGLTDIHIIVLKDNSNISIKYLIGILNSKTINFFYKFIGRRKGNMYEYFVEPLSKIPIKIVSNQNQQIIIQIVEQILTITKTDDYLQNSQKQARVKELERRIDQVVYKLYGLKEEEIRIVEGEK
jgi:hypothetical protein